MNIQALLFDLDGVITESSTAHFQAWQEVALTYGIQIPDDFESSLKGISRRNSVLRILEKTGKSLSEEAIEAFMKQKNDRYLGLIAGFTKDHRLPGVQAIFEWAQSRSLQTALVSASKNGPRLLQALEMTEWFDVIVDPTEHPSKPAPDLFLAAAKALHVPPEACLAFEDANAGIEAIQAAGMTAIGIGDALDADYLFAHLKDAHAFLSTKF